MARLRHNKLAGRNPSRRRRRPAWCFKLFLRGPVGHLAVVIVINQSWSRAVQGVARRFTPLSPPPFRPSKVARTHSHPYPYPHREQNHHHTLIVPKHHHQSLVTGVPFINRSPLRRPLRTDERTFGRCTPNLVPPARPRSAQCLSARCARRRFLVCGYLTLTLGPCVLCVRVPAA